VVRYDCVEQAILDMLSASVDASVLFLLRPFLVDARNALTLLPFVRVTCRVLLFDAKPGYVSCVEGRPAVCRLYSYIEIKVYVYIVKGSRII
jgi:hypothetical protein